MTRPADILPVSCPPRGLSREQSAAYVGTGTTLFDEMVGDGRMPGPKRVNSRTIRFHLDVFDKIQDHSGGSRALRFMLTTRLLQSKDVAEVLGVSASRVSQFYIGAEPVPTATRERILSLLEEFVNALKINRDKDEFAGDQDWLTDTLRDSWISIGERLIKEGRAELQEPAA